MKKQLLTGAFVLASFFGAHAQILSQDFGTDDASFEAAMDDWYTDTASQTDPTTIGFDINDPDPSTLGFTGVSAFSANFINNGTTENPDLQEVDAFNFMVTSPVDLTTVENAYISLKVGVPTASEGAQMGYLIMGLTAEEFDAQNYNNIVQLGAGVFGAGETDTVSFDLADFIGETMRIYIVHTGLTDPETEEPLTSGIGVIQFDDIVVMEGVLGVKENTLANLSVYPNPTSNVVNVTVDALVSNIAIVDLNGRTVKSVKFDGVSTASVNVSDLASGVYMMNVSSDKGTTTKKIVKN